MHALRLSEDRLGPGQGLRLEPAARVLWIAEGEVLIDPGMEKIGREHVWHGSRACQLTSPGGTRLLRWELVTPTRPAPDVETSGGIQSTLRLEHAIALEATTPYLMRCDRVEFEPGGEARPHGHRGGGIRYLLTGRLEVRIAGRPGRVMGPGDSWFESGAEPVHALASATEPTSFLRVSILPRSIRGKSSIVYVDPADANIKPRRYTVYVDEPIEIEERGPERV